jgi:putative nucleotidyltransferase with HDIG domain
MKITDLINFSRFEYNWERIEAIPEFKKLKSCEQNPKWHGEGNAWEHTKIVCEEAVKMCKQNHWENEEGYASLLLTSALFHDIGKCKTTHQGKDGRWHAYGHEFESEKITRRLLWDGDVRFDFIFREKICALVKYHMMPLMIFESKTILEKIVEISREVPCWKILIMLKKCDVLGSYQEDEVSKHADLVKLDSLEKITSRMDCLYKPFGKYLDEYKHFVSYQTKKHINVAVLIGISGAGKSTISDMLVNYAIEFKNGVVVSRDDLRVKLGFCKEGEKAVLSKHNEQIVTDEFNEIVLKAAKEGKPIVLDNLNTKRKYRDSYKSLLSNYDVSWTYYYVEAPTLGDNIERRRGQVEKETLFQMINDIEMPTADEYDSIFYMKTHPGCTIQGE